jgi:RHS repeat-associated protein
LATDIRGTVTADAQGIPFISSPFGDRLDGRPDISAAIDYVEKGFDSDLGTVRMGVRDYDAKINQFLIPDPLYFEAPDKCVASPLSCNLYAYALNKPLNFVDPNGTDAGASMLWEAADSWFSRVEKASGMALDSAAMGELLSTGSVGGPIQIYDATNAPKDLAMSWVMDYDSRVDLLEHDMGKARAQFALELPKAFSGGGLVSIGAKIIYGATYDFEAKGAALRDTVELGAEKILHRLAEKTAGEIAGEAVGTLFNVKNAVDITNAWYNAHDLYKEYRNLQIERYELERQIVPDASVLIWDGGLYKHYLVGPDRTHVQVPR